MDLTIIYVIAGVALNALLLYFWKPWTAAYAGEKGKNFARKEDLDGILAEVRAVTITQKEIEARLSGDLWNRQTQWNKKVETYAALFKAIDELSDGFTSVSSHIKYYGIKTQAGVDLLTTKMNGVSAAQSSFKTAYSFAVIFTNQECLTLIQQWLDSRPPTPNTTSGTLEWALAESENIRLHLSRLPTVAKNDLGIA